MSPGSDIASAWSFLSPKHCPPPISQHLVAQDWEPEWWPMWKQTEGRDVTLLYLPLNWLFAVWVMKAEQPAICMELPQANRKIWILSKRKRLYEDWIPSRSWLLTARGRELRLFKSLRVWSAVGGEIPGGWCGFAHWSLLPKFHAEPQFTVHWTRNRCSVTQTLLSPRKQFISCIGLPHHKSCTYYPRGDQSYCRTKATQVKSDALSPCILFMKTLKFGLWCESQESCPPIIGSQESGQRRMLLKCPADKCL